MFGDLCQRRNRLPAGEKLRVLFDQCPQRHDEGPLQIRTWRQWPRFQ
jgi:hypothetical protein